VTQLESLKSALERLFGGTVTELRQGLLRTHTSPLALAAAALLFSCW
jgi:hypothetical protein